MKIQIFHNKYKQAGGEDIMVEREIQLLRARGHDVRVDFWDNESISAANVLSTAMNCAYSETAKKRAAAVMAEFKPDLCHVHNFFPQITPSVYDACSDLEIPVVQTLHNYRIHCSNALLLRDGKPCELCVKGSPWNGVRHACYRGSRLATLPVANFIRVHRSRGTWNRKVSALVALTDFAKDKFVEGGISPRNLVVRRNYSEDLGLGNQDGDFAICLGRLSPEKGLATLVEAWKPEYPKLLLVGDGPLEKKLPKKANVEILGRVPRAEALGLLKKAKFSLVPTECYEGANPLVLIESLCVGTPVLASRIGGIPEVLSDSPAGLLFEPGNASAIQAAVEKFLAGADPEKARRSAREIYDSFFTEEIAYRGLMEIYQWVKR